MSHTGVQIDKRLLRVAERGDAAQLSRLVSTGISVAGTDKKGNTLLHIAALANSVESCAILIAGGCDIHVKNLKGQTAAELADLKKKKKAFAWLRQQAATESEKATAKAAAVVSAAQTAPPASTSQTKAEEPSSPSHSIPFDINKPSQTSAVVNVLRYDQSDWVPVQTDSTLTLFYTPHPFQFILRATTDGTPPYCIDEELKTEYIYKGSALNTFYNYVGSGDIYGFEFRDETAAESFSDVLLRALDLVEDPPLLAPPHVEVPAPIVEESQPTAPPEAEPVHPPQVESAPPAPPIVKPQESSAPGGPPPPPPPSGAPAKSPAQASTSLAAMIANKRESLTATEVKSKAPGKFSGPAKGGNLMSDLQSKLKNRETETKQEVGRTASYNKPTQPVKSFSKPQSGISGCNITEVDIGIFKQALLEGFRQELGIIKGEIIASIQAELAVVGQ